VHGAIIIGKYIKILPILLTIKGAAFIEEGNFSFDSY
jgi:hypothetical protein